MIDSNYKPIEGDIPQVDLTKSKSPKETTDQAVDSDTQKYGRTTAALFGYGFYPFYEEEENDNEKEEKELLDETDRIIKDLLTKIKGDSDVISKNETVLPSYKDIQSQSIKKALIDLLKLFVNITDENTKVAVINEIMTKLKADTFSDENKRGLLNNLKSKSNAVNDNKE